MRSSVYAFASYTVSAQDYWNLLYEFLKFLETVGLKIRSNSGMNSSRIVEKKIFR